MRIHRIHTQATLEPGLEITLRNGPAHYLGRVLRVMTGQTIVLFNGDGHDYVADVRGLSKREVVLEVISRLPAARESALKITVVQALSRGERMDQTLQKCTELGAVAFQPLISERVEFRLSAEKTAKRLEHWQGVVISACEQSGRAVVPRVYAPMDLPAWLDQQATGMRLVLSPRSELSLKQVDLAENVVLITGPEGGFSDAELDLMGSRGVRAVGLGPRILRTETAAPAAVAILQSLAGDL